MPSRPKVWCEQLEKLRGPGSTIDLSRVPRETLGVVDRYLPAETVSALCDTCDSTEKLPVSAQVPMLSATDYNGSVTITRDDR